MTSDLSVVAFEALHARFFNERGEAIEFDLRDKRNTQDDPFDVEVFETLERRVASDIRCVRAPGPLVSPDMALFRPAVCSGQDRGALRNDSNAIIGLEVKKLERAAGGAIARASGLDYNSTPPCGTIRGYDSVGHPLDMRGFYLFVCLERGRAVGTNKITALALCDGDLLNADFKYYTDITGERSKDVGVGSYGDGANRNRPMVIFANPLGAGVLDHKVTLVHRDPTLESDMLTAVGTIARTEAVSGRRVEFTCYRRGRVGRAVPFNLVDPFPSPKRSERTSGRGRFTVPIRLAN